MRRRSASTSSARPASSTPAGASSAASSIPTRSITRRRRWWRSASKCLVGDQLHPNGAINHGHLRLDRARPMRASRSSSPISRARARSPKSPSSSAEYFHPVGGRNNLSDDGAAQMLQELKHPVRRHRSGTPASRTTGCSSCPTRSRSTANWPSGCAPMSPAAASSSALGQFGPRCRRQLRARRRHRPQAGEPVDVRPVLHAGRAAELDPGMTATPFVVYGSGARRSRPRAPRCWPSSSRPISTAAYAHFCSHQHTPDDPDGGAARRRRHRAPRHRLHRLSRSSDMYHAMGQPLYKYIVRGLIDRLHAGPGARHRPAVVRARDADRQQARRTRHILHLLYGAAAGARQGACRSTTAARASWR